jgi:hypothetical protein
MAKNHPKSYEHYKVLGSDVYLEPVSRRIAREAGVDVGMIERYDPYYYNPRKKRSRK